MLRNYMGIINLEEKESNIRSLTSYRPIGTIPFAGRYRVIDFMLSNMVNAGISHVSVFTNKFTRSLIDHLGSGKPWDLDRKIDGLFTFSHSLLGLSNVDAKAFGNNMEFITKTKFEYVILSSSYMLCNIDLEAVAAAHEKSGADITAVYTYAKGCADRFLNCDTLKFDENRKILSVAKNIGIDESANICMEIFVMKKSVLTDLMYHAMSDGVRGSFKNVIYDHIFTHNVQGYEFSGTVRCINSVESYYRANMDMLRLDIVGELFAETRPIFTKTKDSPPTQYTKESNVKNAIIGDGCIIRGKVTESVISRHVMIEEGVELDGCIILQNAVIKKGAKLSNVIVDKGVTVDPNVVVNCPKQYPLVFEKKQQFIEMER